MSVLFANNATSLLASTFGSGATTLTINGADASKFPTPTGGDWFPVTILDSGGNVEILRCTARSGANLTVTRAQEGTSAQNFSIGARVDCRLTAGALTAIIALIVSSVAPKLDSSAYNAPDVFAKVLSQDANDSGLNATTINGVNLAGLRDASQLTGTIDPARIPVIATQKQVISASATIAGLSAPEQADVTGPGVVVTTTDGKRWLYKGSGSKITEASYIELGDVTPEWAAIQNKMDATPAAAGLMPAADKTKLDRWGAGVVTISTASTLDASHAGKLIVLSGAVDFDLAITAATTLKNGWTCFLKATSSIVVTLDPNGVETIDGSTTLPLAKGQECWLECDGTNFYTIGLNRTVRLDPATFAGASSSAFALPPGFAVFQFTLLNIVTTVNDAELAARVSTDGGSTWVSGANTYDRADLSPNVAGSVHSSAGTLDRIPIWVRPEAGRPFNGNGHLFSARNAAARTVWRGASVGKRYTQNYATQEHGGERLVAEDNNAVQFFPTAGAMSGTILIHGIVP